MCMMIFFSPGRTLFVFMHEIEPGRDKRRINRRRSSSVRSRVLGTFRRFMAVGLE